jgi:hypothetical protein
MQNQQQKISQEAAEELLGQSRKRERRLAKKQKQRQKH